MGEPIAPSIHDEEIKKLTAPTYVLMGEYEKSFNPYQALERAINLLSELIAAEIVPGVGHSMEHRDPDWVIPRVMNFLDAYAV